LTKRNGPYNANVCLVRSAERVAAGAVMFLALHPHLADNKGRKDYGWHALEARISTY
jgi:hypothetical protein